MRFPYLKRLQEFDFDAQSSLDRRLIEELATGRFLHEGRNIVFLGPPGVGKTHLAIALDVIMTELGHRVTITSALVMARRLAKALEQNTLHREMNNLTRPKLLIIDEVGYLKLEPAQARLLFQVICARYERNGALILTSNKAFGEWGEVFGGDAIMASAALDRLLHRATVVNIRGESYRFKEKRQANGHHQNGGETKSEIGNKTGNGDDPGSQKPIRKIRKTRQVGQFFKRLDNNCKAEPSAFQSPSRCTKLYIDHINSPQHHF